MTSENGNRNGDRADADAARIAEVEERVQQAVRVVPDPARGPLTREDVAVLREAELADVAELAEKFVPHSG